MKNELIAPVAKDRRIIYKCHGKTAFEQDFILPSREKDSWFLFESEDKPVIIFPLTKKNEVIAVKHFRYGSNSFVIEVPGGKIESNITEKNIKESAKKELCEETGFTSENIILVGPQTWFDPASVRVSFSPVLALKCWKISESRPKTTEILKTKLIPFQKWVEMIKRQEICDSKTVAITMMVLCHLYADRIINVIK